VNISQIAAWRPYLKGALWGLFLNYGLLSGIILLLSNSLPDEALRQGFIVMAAVPPAVAVLPMMLFGPAAGLPSAFAVLAETAFFILLTIIKPRYP
jgi:BASS family bile acid:Na+ symporter